MKPRITQLIDYIRANGGIIDFAEDLDDFIALDRLLDAQEHADAVADVDLLQRPVAVGNALFFRLSWGALEWLRECAGAWWGSDPTRYALATIYAHAHANDPQAFGGRLAADPRHAARIIRAFARRMDAPIAAVEAALASMNKPDEPQDDDPPFDQDKPRRSISQSDILARLEREYSRPPEFFLFEISQEMLETHIQRMCTRETEEVNRLAAIHDCKLQANPDSPQAMAFRRVSLKIKQITSKCMARKKGKSNG